MGECGRNRRLSGATPGPAHSERTRLPGTSFGTELAHSDNGVSPSTGRRSGTAALTRRSRQERDSAGRGCLPTSYAGTGQTAALPSHFLRSDPSDGTLLGCGSVVRARNPSLAHLPVREKARAISRDRLPPRHRCPAPHRFGPEPPSARAPGHQRPKRKPGRQTPSRWREGPGCSRTPAMQG
jgi:hypothetical protein